MAKVLQPMGGVSVVGSVGGLKYGIFRGVNYVSAKSSPGRRLRPLSGYASDNRSRFGWLASAWGLLSAVDRAQWDAYAQNHPQVNSQGVSFLLDGNQMHQKLNHVCCRFSGVAGYQSLPPLSDVVPRVDSLVAVPGAMTKEIAVTITLAGTGLVGEYIEFQLAGPFESPGRRAVKSRFKYNTMIVGNLLVGVVTCIAANKYHWVRARYISAKGQCTNWVYYQSKSKA